MRRFSSFVLLAVLFALALLPTQVQPAHAAGIVVNSLDDIVGDDGKCTLREAITAANTDTPSGGLAGECAAGSGVDTITFSVTGSINLTDDLPDLTTDMTIDGPGASLLTLNASNSTPMQIFYIIGATVNLHGMTMRGACICGGNGLSSGGIYNSRGTLTVRDSVITDNERSSGAGIYSYNGSLTVVNSIISNNTAISLAGGGIFTASAQLTVVNSTISGNTAASYGGGMALGDTPTQIINTTISGNTANGGLGTSGGGAINIFVGSPTMTITNSTIAYNAAPNVEGGIRGGIWREAGTLTITNSIVAHNGSTTLGGTNNCLGTIIDGGGNLDNGTSCGFGGSSLSNTDPMLVGTTPANNGGHVPTFALQTDSPAINGGNNALIADDILDLNGDGSTTDDLPYDARGAGFPRIIAGTVDIGAFEALEQPDFVVDTLSDADLRGCLASVAGDCSLRGAINLANSTPGVETITFSVTGTINLTDALPVLNTNMTIDGPGASLLTVNANSSGSPARRIFHIIGATVNLHGMTLTGGRCDDCLSSESQGGAISNAGGTLTVRNSVITDNQGFRGGGIYTANGSLTVVNTVISNNTAGGGAGGGGIQASNSPMLTVVNSTISGNTATYGGGIGIANSTAQIINTTISGNTATGSSPFQGGGALDIYGSNPTVTIANSTIAYNAAPNVESGTRAGIWHETGTLTITNSIVAHNGSTTLGGTNNCVGIITDGGGNLDNGTSCGFGGSSLSNTDPMLVGTTPADNGGGVPTFALQAGSPAINGGDNSLIADDILDLNGDGSTTDDLPYDARGAGFPRIIAGTVDIGAFEALEQPDFVVDTLSDDDLRGCLASVAGDCSLRGAINLANATPGAQTITFSVTGTINLTDALPVLNTNMTIDGPGAALLTVNANSSGSPARRIFHIIGATVNLHGMTLTGGRCDDCSSSDSQGGAIYNQGGTVTVRNSVITDNQAYRGGGIASSNASLTIVNTVVSNNTAMTGTGGGIYNVGAQLTVVNSTISGNTTKTYGGGITLLNTSAQIINTTISGNTASGNGGLDGGGAINIYAGSPTVTITNSTIVYNAAPNAASGARSGIWHEAGTLTITNSIVAHNGSTTLGGTNNCVGTIIDGGGNLDNGSTCGFGASSLSNTDAMLVGTTPADNGGGVPTFALQAGSPAINGGNNALIADDILDLNGNGSTTDDLPYDARGAGFPRVNHGTVDIGAFEALEQPDFVVDTLSDADLQGCLASVAGDCSLRGAINLANSTPGVETITFSVTGTINLTNALPQIITDMTIEGPGAALLTINANDDSDNSRRVFNINNATVNLLDMTLTGGHCSSICSLFNGGAISNAGGTLTVRNSVITDNQALLGAGIYSTGSSSLTVVNTIIRNNTNAVGGGGIYASNSTTLTVVNSTISGNTATYGGGIGINNSTAQIINTTISGNTAFGNGGGAINIYAGSPTVTITNSTIAYNAAPNAASGARAGIWHESGTLTITNSIVAHNGSTTLGGTNNCVGIITDSGGNLDNGSTCGFGASSLSNTDAMLVGTTPADNGGGVPTFALQAGSPAINGGNNALIADDILDLNGDGSTTDDLPYDARGAGFPRVNHGTVDIGAFEAPEPPDFVVDTLSDADLQGCLASVAGDCSLRGAITLANSTPGVETITFSVTGTITLTDALPTINTDMTIDGPGAALLTVNANGDSGNSRRVFNINNATVNLLDMTLTGGRCSSICSGFNGGAISNAGGTLTVRNSVITDNQALLGAGIYSTGSSSLTVVNTIIRNNTNAVGGGGIQASNSTTLTVVNSTISGNTATYGGGIGINNSTAQIINTTISGNTASGNRGIDGGGALNIYAGSPTVTITNSTIVYNAAPNAASGARSGIWHEAGTLTITNSIVTHNGSTTLGGTNNCVGIITDGGGNLDNGSTCGFGASSLSNTDPMLVGTTPADNGGGVPTFALQSGSPAINGGDNSLIADDILDLNGDGSTTDDLPYDARGAGFPRIIAGTVDIGAFEAPEQPDFVVDTLSDDNLQGCLASVAGDCSLRGAITLANATPGAQTITFNVTGQIDLLNPLPEITTDMTIDGPGAASLTVNAGDVNGRRVFTVTGAATVDMMDMTITGGQCASGCMVSADFGGGIYNFGGTLTVRNSIINGNSASIGGGIATDNGTSTIINSVISGNEASAGGGLANYFGTLNVVSSTVSDNLSTIYGGGIYNEIATLNVINSTISGNTATNFGGGFALSAGTVQIFNTTISANTAINIGGGAMDLAHNPNVTVRNSTIAYNASPNQPASSGIRHQSGTLTFSNTIIAHNGSTTLGGTNNCVGTITDGGGNLDNGSTCGFGGSSLSNTDPMLVGTTPADNGGGVPTFALQVGSPAINGGNNSQIPNDIVDLNGDNNTTDAIPYDARGAGFSRIAAGTIDIGAFEDQNPVTALVFTQQPTDTNENATITPAVTVELRNSSNTLVDLDGVNITIAIEDNPSLGTLNGTLTVATVDGVATFSNLSIDIPGTGYSLEATIGALNSESASFNILSTALPGITITDASPNPMQEGGTATYTIVLNAAPNAGETVTIKPSGFNNRFITVDPVQVQFTSANWNVPRTITITAIDDLVDRGSRYQTAIQHVVTTNGTKYAGITADRVRININDNELNAGQAQTQAYYDALNLAAWLEITPNAIPAGAANIGAMVHLNGQPLPGEVVVVNVYVGAGVTAYPSQLVFTEHNWNIAQPVTLIAAVEGGTPLQVVVDANSTTSPEFIGAAQAVSVTVLPAGTGVIPAEQPAAPFVPAPEAVDTTSEGSIGE